MATAVFAVATILTRTTTGWAIAITVIVVGAIGAVRRRNARGALVLVAGGVVAIVVGLGGQLGEVSPPVHVSARAPGVDRASAVADDSP